MMPNVCGEATTKRQIVVYAVLTALSGICPTLLGFASLGYGAFAAAMGLGFVWYSLGVLRMPEGDKRMLPAKKLFGFSIAYLFAIFSALLADLLIAGIWRGGIV
jgi:protoheme IX farnesyltransferase